MRNRELLINRLDRLDGQARQLEFYLNRPVSSTKDIDTCFEQMKSLVNECKDIVDREEHSGKDFRK